ncbi:MAG: tetratricopeptide repeat protein [candidate division Zixibacteria bacterium]|nr:tetratricopeptide repeat protein [candidate division Zixibacteria bacterium]
MRSLVSIIAGALMLLSILSSSALATIDADSVKTLVREADIASAGEDYKRAITLYREVLKNDTNNFAALESLGFLYQVLGNHRQAKAYLQKAFQVDSLNAALNNNLGAIYVNESNSAEAIRYYERAVAIDSTNAAYLNNLGQEYAKVGQLGKALPALYRADSLRPDQDETLLSIGSCFAASNSLDSAAHYFQKSIEAGGKTARLHYLMGSVLARMGRNEAAEKHLDHVIKIEPGHIQATQALGLLYLQTKQPDRAEELFGKLANDNPDFHQAKVGLGMAHALQGHTAAADSVLEVLFGIDSSYAFQMLNILRQEAEKEATSRKK